jgi:hypothetical protein
LVRFDHASRARDKLYHPTLWVALVRDERGRARRHNDAHNLHVRVPVYWMFITARCAVDRISAIGTLVAVALALKIVTWPKTKFLA